MNMENKITLDPLNDVSDNTVVRVKIKKLFKSRNKFVITCFASTVTRIIRAYLTNSQVQEPSPGCPISNQTLVSPSLVVVRWSRLIKLW